MGQTGGTSYPTSNSGWALEISLDVETVHTMCDTVFLLVEAKSASNSDLLKAVDTAVNLGATIISNSYGGSESTTEISSDNHFNQPGIAIFASAGDDGYGVSYPATSQYVVGVGGTKLTLTSTGAYSSESAWTDGGSRYSVYETKPTWHMTLDARSVLLPTFLLMQTLHPVRLFMTVLNIITKKVGSRLVEQVFHLHLLLESSRREIH
jgi:subtilase family serine protease